ncbi:MAG: hypothetical protein O7H41_01890 [Planctomycetota bacterium]|nr:hypothetical protein [Planctomycetota bacterium]
MALPKVSVATGNAVLGELRGDRGGKRIQELLGRLESANPCIARFIHQLSNRRPQSAEVYAAALVVYRLLESQDDADRLKEEFIWEDDLPSPASRNSN